MLKVENILVLGHSSCAGIQGLMIMEDDAINSRFHFLQLPCISYVTIQAHR